MNIGWHTPLVRQLGAFSSSPLLLAGFSVSAKLQPHEAKWHRLTCNLHHLVWPTLTSSCRWASLKVLSSASIWCILDLRVSSWACSSLTCSSLRGSVFSGSVPSDATCFCVLSICCFSIRMFWLYLQAPVSSTYRSSPYLEKRSVVRTRCLTSANCLCPTFQRAGLLLGLLCWLHVLLLPCDRAFACISPMIKGTRLPRPCMQESSGKAWALRWTAQPLPQLTFSLLSAEGPALWEPLSVSLWETL